MVTIKESSERMENEIRNNWFKNHKAIITGEKGFQQIIWSKGTFEYHTKYILSGNNLFISGDLGEAVYTLTCAATLENIKSFNLGYFTGKLSAFCESKYKFNEDLAKKQLDEELKHWSNPKRASEVKETILDVIDKSHSVDSYQFWLQVAYHDGDIECDDVELFFEFGQELSCRIIAYWIGLQMIAEQLENENGIKEGEMN